MLNADEISYLRERLNALSQMFSALSPLLDQLKEHINEQEFIPAPLETSVREQLSELISYQKDLIERYANLGLENIPSKISIMDSELEQQFKFITEKKTFSDIIQFVNGLHSKMPDIEAELSKERTAASNFDYSGSSVEECRNALGKYFLLKETLEETDAQKKFKLIMDKLNSIFSFQIVYGLNINAITYSAPSVNVVVSYENTTEGTETPSGDLTNPNEEKNPEEASVPESEEANPGTGDTMPSSSENPEISDSVPTQDTADTASLTWDKLGISDPATLCVDISDENLKVRTASKSKKFGANSFKNDMCRSHRPEKTILMRRAFDNNGVNPCALGRLLEKPEADFATAADKLVQAGYFKEYVLKKGESEYYEPYYVLTPNGLKVFSSKEASAFLDRKPIKGFSDRDPIPDKANSLLARIICCKTEDLMLNICPGGEFTQGPLVLSTDYFVSAFAISSPKKNYFFTSIISSDFEEFLHLKEFFETFDASNNVLVIVGMTPAHAKSLATWLQSTIKAAVPENALYYYDLETEQYHDMEDNIVILLEENKVEDTATAEEASDVATEEDITHVTDEEDAATVATPENTPDTDPETLPKNDTDSIDNSDDESNDTISPNTIAAETVSEPEVKSVPEHVDPVVKVTHTESVSAALSSAAVADYSEKYQQMLATDKFYCATAYLNALSRKYPDFKSPQRQLAYALNDPLGNCTYSSDRLFTVYFTESSQLSEYYTVSAVLRNYFLDQCSYDYSLQMLQGSISNFDILQNNGALNQAVYTIQQFKAQNHKGIDYYADYRQKKREAFEETLRTIRAEARELYENHCLGKESGFHRRLIETKSIIYGEGSDLATYLEAVKDDTRDYLSLITDFLTTYYIKDNMDIVADNIAPEKIDAVIDDAWDIAGKRMSLYKKSADLMGSYRMNTFKQIRKMVAVLCDYVSIVATNTLNIDDPGFIAYRRVRKSLVENLEGALNFIQDNPASTLSELAGQHVLTYTLETLLSRIDGSYEEGIMRYFYLEFLQGDYVLLDDDYLPVLEEVAEIDELSVLSRIEEHAKSSCDSLENRFEAILNGADDYGSARLIQNYLKSHASSVVNPELLTISIDKAITYPRKDLEAKRREFIEDLELAQSYGQIDNTTEDRKETLIQIMDSWYDWAVESGNYGFFYKILAAIRAKIKEDAQVRAIDLERNLTLYKTAHADWEENEQIAIVIDKIAKRIETQNYAAAEDLLNRLIAGDLDTNIEFIQNDYLAEFLKEYTLNATKAGKASSTLQASLSRGHNKDSRAANRLIDSWPKGNGTSPSKISDLLTTLGFAVDTVSSQPAIQGKDHFQVTLKRPSNGRKSNYKHPISAFGSEAEEKGFRVISIFGKMDASRLIDTFKEIGSAKNTLVLLDYSLTLPDRRELARRTKTELNGKSFVVIDRVVLVYLASHYSETAVNRMLMAITMPFASYQPYVSDSSKIMPQEIFMGRKTELHKIESASGVNIVYGGRQLGKSALLRMAQKDINNDENGDRAVLVDVKGLDYKAAAKKISAALFDEKVLLTEHITDDWDELSRDIKNRLRDTTSGRAIPYLLLLMDEADVFIESCEAVDYRPFDALKDIQSIGSDRFKFVVAGLRNIVRFKKNIALSNNSVLTHLSSLTVTPFKSTEARELLEVPLSYLGFRFPNDSKTEMLISTIFGTTNYFPGLLQLYCSKLIEALQRDYAGYDENETPPYVVKEAHIKKVLSDKTLEQQIREKYFITLKVDEDDYYYLIALLAAFNYHNNKGQNGCDASDIIEIADSYGISKIASLSKDKVTALMEEMRELNVLQQIGNGKYRFARHSFCQMMGNMSQIDDEIMAYAVAQEE